MENQGFGYTVWLDNLFTSARLLKRLRDFGIGGAGTVRTTKTKREEKEIKARDKAKEKEKERDPQSQPNHDPERLEAEGNRGPNPSIADIKIKHATKLSD
jgi:hypothetical protein